MIRQSTVEKVSDLYYNSDYLDNPAVGTWQHYCHRPPGVETACGPYLHQGLETQNA